MKTNTILSLFAHATLGSAQILLGTAASFGVLSKDSITNTGPSAITGNIGTTGSSITGFPPGTFTGSEFISTAATTPYNDAQTAYNQVAALTGAIPLTGDLSGVTLGPGTYSFSSSASLSTGGLLTLAGTGSSSDAWNFQIATTLITGSGSSVVLTNGGQACRVFWQVGSSATLGTGSTFVGTILAALSVTGDTNAVTTGGLFALGGSATLDSNTVAITACAAVSSTASSTTHTSSPSTSKTVTTTTTHSSTSSVKPSTSTTTTHSPTTSSTHSTTASSSKSTSSSVSKISTTSSSSKISTSTSKATTSTSSKSTTKISTTSSKSSSTCPCATTVVTQTVYSGICSSVLATSTVRSTSTVYLTAICT